MNQQSEDYWSNDKAKSEWDGNPWSMTLDLSDDGKDVGRVVSDFQVETTIILGPKVKRANNHNLIRWLPQLINSVNSYCLRFRQLLRKLATGMWLHWHEKVDTITLSSLLHTICFLAYVNACTRSLMVTGC